MSQLPPQSPQSTHSPPLEPLNQEWEDKEKELEDINQILRQMSSQGFWTTRMKFLILVSERPRTRKEIASQLGISQPTCSQHLDKLKYVGLVKETREREITLNVETIESLIQFLQENLNLTKETTTNV